MRRLTPVLLQPLCHQILHSAAPAAVYHAVPRANPGIPRRI